MHNFQQGSVQTMVQVTVNEESERAWGKYEALEEKLKKYKRAAGKET